MTYFIVGIIVAGAIGVAAYIYRKRIQSKANEIKDKAVDKLQGK